MKKAIATTAILATLALTGCSDAKPDVDTNVNSGLYENTVQLNDGRAITCVTSRVGISCDWGGAK